MIRFSFRVLVAAFLLTTVATTFAHAQEDSATDSGFYPRPVEYEIQGLPLGGKNLIDSAYSQFTQCSDYECTVDDMICVSDSADKCHSDWVDTRVDGHEGNMLFVNGHGVLNPRVMERPVVRYVADLRKDRRYAFKMRSRNICGWCEAYPQLNGEVSLELFTGEGKHVKHLVQFRVENNWVEYSVELSPEESGFYQIVVYNLTCVWSGNDFALDAKLVELKHEHDDKCGHEREHDDDRRAPRPGSRRR